MIEILVKSVLREKTEQLAPVSKINLWPVIQSRISMEVNQMNETTKSRKPEINTGGNRITGLRLAATITLVVLLVTGVYFATPQGQAVAQNILQFFTRAESNQLPVQTSQLKPPVNETNQSSDPASIIDAYMSIQEVQQQAGFVVFTPSWVPENLTFAGASNDVNTGIVRIFYQYFENNGLVFRQEQIPLSDSCDLCGKVGADADVQEISINGVYGEFAEGTWKLTDNGPEWVSDPYLKTMRWQEGGMVFELLYMGPPETLSKEKMIEIAESIN